MAIPFHQLATIFPAIEGAEFEQLVENIRVHGVRDPIVLFDGQVLEGRNRYRALAWLVSTGEILGDGWGHRSGLHLTEEELQPDNIWFTQYNVGVDGDPLSYVISKNLIRRHLTESQRAMVAADLATMRQGERTDLQPSENLPKVSQGEAAKLLNVSDRSLRTANTVKQSAAPEIQNAVKQGNLSVSAAVELAMQPVARQQEILAELPRTADGRLTAEAKKALAPVVKELRAEKQQEKRQARSEREQQLAAKILALPNRKFGVILEDFEWDHKPYSRETGMDRHPSNHYVTAHDAHSPEEIVARTATRFACAADDSVLYMWATIPHSFIAMQVMALRGYTYKTQRVWNKLRSGKARGSGYWVTGEHEILLIGTRGKFNAAPVEAHFRSNFDAPAGEHSEKPDQQYEHAEFHFPTLPKIELNARRARPGWTAWGLDAPEQESSVSPVPIAANDVTTGAGDPNSPARNPVVTESSQAKADVPAPDEVRAADVASSASRLADGRTSAGGAGELPSAPPPLADDAHGCTAPQSSAGNAAATPAASPLFSDDPKSVELGKLRTVNHGDRADAAKYADELIACGHAFEIRPGDWALTRAGLARAELLQAELGSPAVAFSDRGTDIPKFLPARATQPAEVDIGIPAFLRRDENNVSPAMRGQGAA